MVDQLEAFHVEEKEEIDTSSKQTTHFKTVKDYIGDLKRKGGPFYAMPLDRHGIVGHSISEENGAIFRCTRCQNIPFEPMRCTGCDTIVCKYQCTQNVKCCPSSLCQDSKKRELTQIEMEALS